jgi:hypothetical protein
MDIVQKYNSFNTNTPSSESYRNDSHSMGAGETSLKVKQPEMKLTIHLYLVPRLRMHGVLPSLPHMFSWHYA